MVGVDKLFARVGGIPLLLHSLRAFDSAPAIRSVTVVSSETAIKDIRRMVDDCSLTKIAAVVTGGARRQDSTARGLDVVTDAEIVLVHDGARPFVDENIIERAVNAAVEWRAASAAAPVKDTIKIASPDMTVADTPDRSTLWAAQTPQAFAADILRVAHARCEGDFTDDAAMVEALGHPVRLFMGSYDNIKITTPGDLRLAEAIYARRREEEAAEEVS